MIVLMLPGKFNINKGKAIMICKVLNMFQSMESAPLNSICKAMDETSWAYIASVML